MSRVPVWCFSAIFILIGLVSCGKKTLPVPELKSTYHVPEAIIEKAEYRPDGLYLKWKVSKEQKGFCFVVEKVEIPWKGLSCIDCPELPWEQSKCVDPAFPEPAVRIGDWLIWKDDRVMVGHAYRFRLVVFDLTKRRPVKYGQPYDVRIPSTPPNVVKGDVKAGKEGILITWFIPSGAKDAIKKRLRFRVERMADGDTGWTRLDGAGCTDSSYLDGEVTPGKLYTYRVTPYYTIASLEVYGKPFVVGKARAQDTVLPPPPKTVWVVPGKKGLEVHWLEVTVPVGGYHVYRKESEGTIVRLTQKPIMHPPFVDTNVKWNKVYSYAVTSLSPNPPHREGLASSWVEIRNVFFK